MVLSSYWTKRFREANRETAARKRGQSGKNSFKPSCFKVQILKGWNNPSNWVLKSKKVWEFRNTLLSLSLRAWRSMHWHRGCSGGLSAWPSLCSGSCEIQRYPRWHGRRTRPWSEGEISGTLGIWVHRYSLTSTQAYLRAKFTLVGLVDDLGQM